ncbi:MAG TPA: antitoxin VapB family protein [Thermoanaerobaculia bacterium]|nr:antitoxin VapB family protein [Thermoanaerobaculia bacterium]
MATKTITLELDAYEKLRSAKRGPRESFSSVVRRARWDGSADAGDVVGRLRDLYLHHPLSFLADESLDRIEDRARRRGRRPRAEARAE